ncbi:MAG: alpha-amylase [Propionibacteriaceae bacterium]|uniref:Glycoside hydrolase superfamily n=1 Tax=Propionibacterium ruminifibrarum TaxID=1962131 RepID=A0A375I061_9ACTN|nr:alpha-amylase family protein [Propionibacterium ruminifibrarum]MBE6476826.1 alpha-amylase [Propionibacteriaceae bacterium]SPF68167.1 Glycoside hydrolase superfamily [Propionibacterium ruminifibrarum]
MSLPADTATWWHVYPLGALGAPIHDRPTDGDHAHRLRRLDPWLDYVAELGCTGLLLGPIFASTSHGYDTVDHHRIDPRLGDDADFDRLVARARERGLSVLLDGVFNHVGRRHGLVDKTLEAGAGPVRLDETGHGPAPHPWEGHDDLAELDHDDPAVGELVESVMLHWLRRGIAGWRLDAAYCVPPRFWREVIGRTRTEFPEALFVAEMIHGDYADFAQASGIDAVTQYELWKAIWSSVLDTNLWELAWALERHERFNARALTQTFVGNHDVTRIASRVGDAGAVLALVVLMSVPGMPSIYYGDEQAFRGVKGSGPRGDDPLRPELPDSPAQLAPHGWWLHDLHRELIGLRHRNPWLTGGHVAVVAKDCTWIDYETTAPGHRLQVHIELEPGPAARIVIDGAPAFDWHG